MKEMEKVKDKEANGQDKKKNLVMEMKGLRYEKTT